MISYAIKKSLHELLGVTRWSMSYSLLRKKCHTIPTWVTMSGPWQASYMMWTGLVHGEQDAVFVSTGQRDCLRDFTPKQLSNGWMAQAHFYPSDQEAEERGKLRGGRSASWCHLSLFCPWGLAILEPFVSQTTTKSSFFKCPLQAVGASAVVGTVILFIDILNLTPS